MIALEELNRLMLPAFAQRLTGIFEHSPWVPQRAHARGPFASRLDLLDAMRGVVREASGEEQLALIAAHPKLGARGRTRAELTAASSREQKRAGLDACSESEYAHLQQVNAAYLQKFGFPFILAVRGHDPAAIIAQLERRYSHDRAWELRTALKEIGLIASYRLAEGVSSTAAAEIAAMLSRLRTGPQAEPPGRLITEWMRAANLSVEFNDEHRLIGVAHSTDLNVRTLLIGLHYDRATGSLVSDGSQGWATGIAVAARLREQGLQLPFDLAVFADTHAETRADPIAALSEAIDAGLPCGRVMLGSIDEARSQNREMLAILRGAGLTNVDWVIEGDRMSKDVEHSACALQKTLLHAPAAT